ncbi:hypothetical protein ANRL1_00105 [Anaerolineae bacterium]|nr:hypothetical protein ANRL1_00105 [Anaerolineae bacterium]
MSLNTSWFPKQVPPKPSGYYAQIITLRVTDSYAVFQTDGELNTARVAAGENDKQIVTRLTIFKRKQTAPERLTGREMLRHYELITAESCDYNVKFCMTCPDCIAYGFAIGDAGSEKSKVITDTGYSLTPYESSHEAFTLNAPYESGTMSRQGEVTSRINEADHVRPQVVFPAVITTRDLTAPLFEYVLTNVLRTSRYGAQPTRTGTVQNRIVAIALTDGEIFSNLKLTQILHDALKAQGKFNPPDPLDPDAAFSAAQNAAPDLLKADGVAPSQLLIGKELEAYLQGFVSRLNSADSVKAMLQAAFADSKLYYETFVAKK